MLTEPGLQVLVLSGDSVVFGRELLCFLLSSLDQIGLRSAPVGPFLDVFSVQGLGIFQCLVMVEPELDELLEVF